MRTAPFGVSFNHLVDDSAVVVETTGMTRPAANELDAVFAALADPTRRALVGMLLEGDRPVTALAEPFEMSLAAVSKHLAILARAGLVSQRREGRTRWCRLHPEGLKSTALWLESIGQIDILDLDALEGRLVTEGLLADDGLHPVHGSEGIDP